jgi:hypothetical protein
VICLDANPAFADFPIAMMADVLNPAVNLADVSRAVDIAVDARRWDATKLIFLLRPRDKNLPAF